MRAMLLTVFKHKMKDGQLLFSSSPSVAEQEEMSLCGAQCGRFRTDDKHLLRVRPVRTGMCDQGWSESGFFYTSLKVSGA